MSEQCSILKHRSLCALFFLSLASCCISEGMSQSILDGYIQLGLRNNQRLISSQLDSEIQHEVVNQAKGKYLPNIFLDASYTRAEGGRTIDVPAGDLVNPIYSGLNQLVGSDIYPTAIPNQSEQFLPDNFHETKIRLIQPILNTDILFNQAIQKKVLASKEAKEQAYENKLIQEIKVAYYNHLAAREQVKILLTTQVILEEALRVSRALVKNDKETKEVIFGAQAELSRLKSELATAEKQKKVSAIFFNYLLDRPLSEIILVEDQLPRISESAVNLDSLTRNALANRRELDEIRYGLDATSSNTRLSKNYIIPQINLIGDVGYQGFGYEFDNTQDFWFLRLGLTWPIFQGNQNQSKIRQSLLEEKKLENQLRETENLISLEVAEGFYAYEESILTLAARLAARKNAEENFRIIEKKYAQNLVPQVTFTEARNTYTTAEIQEVVAKYTVLIREANLEASISLRNL